MIVLLFLDGSLGIGWFRMGTSTRKCFKRIESLQTYLMAVQQKSTPASFLGTPASGGYCSTYFRTSCKIPHTFLIDRAPLLEPNPEDIRGELMTSWCVWLSEGNNGSPQGQGWLR